MSTAAPVLRLHADRVPAWRRLLAVADAAVARVSLLWYDWFTAARSQLRRTDLGEVLSRPNILEARMVVSDILAQTIDVPARAHLPLAGTEIVEAAAEVSLPPLRALTGQPVTFTKGLVETEQWIRQFVGTQIRDINATTLRTVQDTLREGWRTGQHPRVLARTLRESIGLTPRQQQTLAKLRTRLEEQGKKPAEVRRAVERAAQVALRQRALNVARTETLTFANRGAYETLLQSVRAGFVDEDRVRRKWLVTPDDRLCSLCSSVPGMNPDGVGLHVSFHTPWGALLYPPGHPSCRCATTTTLLPAA